MEFKLSFDRFAVLMNLERETVLQQAELLINRSVPKARINQASGKLKKEFRHLFGVDYEEVKENIDLKSWNRNIQNLWKGKDVDFSSSGSGLAKRKRRSANDSLNESFLANFEESASLDNVDEVVRLRAENAILRKNCKAMQELFVKKRVKTPRSRNSGGSVLTYSNKMRALSISLLAQGESASFVHRVLKTMTVITPELLESADGVVGIPCSQTLSLWRDTIPGLNDVQSKLFIEASDRFVIGKLCYSNSR